ncbi:hypothetical protein PFISCL1PPCAC_19951 [Pristionchus fissidentatus]|uniref:Uncharacterized protein n=1 Tax=Pristionchus fissidentatus TaxID=1538716 RepID=A0AAV5W9J8_9BILA|nr:hypothetical protein PFISCL1PPCAC_19951 [Pristionchus fissidentatus]
MKRARGNNGFLSRMLGGLRETLKGIQDEMCEGMENLRKMTLRTEGDDVERLRYETINVVSSSAGGNLLMKYDNEVEEVKKTTDRNIRFADLCSTRLGRVQQESMEKATTTIQLDNFLRYNKRINESLRIIEQQMEKVARFCLQTEGAITHLEALSIVLESEGKVNEIRKRSCRLSQVVSVAPPLVTAQPREASEEMRDKQEEIMLEEFLSTQ